MTRLEAHSIANNLIRHFILNGKEGIVAGALPLRVWRGPMRVWLCTLKI
jgi:hypothetical protein